MPLFDDFAEWGRRPGNGQMIANMGLGLLAASQPRLATDPRTSMDMAAPFLHRGLAAPARAREQQRRTKLTDAQIKHIETQDSATKARLEREAAIQKLLGSAFGVNATQDTIPGERAPVPVPPPNLMGPRTDIPQQAPQQSGFSPQQRQALMQAAAMGDQRSIGMLNYDNSRRAAAASARS